MINKVIFDWVLNGREISIVFNNFNGNAQYSARLEKAINNIPGAKITNKEQSADTIVFKCRCIGSTADIEDFLREAMSAEFGETAALPQTTKIKLDEVQLVCPK